MFLLNISVVKMSPAPQEQSRLLPGPPIDSEVKQFIQLFGGLGRNLIRHTDHYGSYGATHACSLKY